MALLEQVSLVGGSVLLGVGLEVLKDPVFSLCQSSHQDVKLSVYSLAPYVQPCSCCDDNRLSL